MIVEKIPAELIPELLHVKGMAKVLVYQAVEDNYRVPGRTVIRIAHFASFFSNVEITMFRQKR